VCILVLVFCSTAVAQAPTRQNEKAAQAKRVFEEAETLSEQGTAEHSRLALAKYQEASSLYREIGDRHGEALSLSLMGAVSSKLGERVSALQFYEKALVLYRALNERSWEALTLSSMGNVSQEAGDGQKALEYFNQALPIWHVVGDSAVEATTLTAIGEIYSLAGDKQKALEYFHRALPLTGNIVEKNVRAATLNNIGAMHRDLGEKAKALEYYNQALLIWKALDDKSGEATVLSNIGVVYGELGEKAKALEYFNQALRLRRADSDKSGEANTLNNIGAIYQESGEAASALKYYKQALELARAVRDKSGEAIIFNNIGKTYDDFGEPARALKYYDQALPLTRAVGEKSGEATTLNNYGLAYFALGEKRKALDYHRQALLLFRAIGDGRKEASALNSMMHIWESLGNRRLAIFYGKQSVNKRQELRGVVQSLDNETQKSFLRSIGGAYRYLTELLIKEGQPEQAVQILNLYRDQQFFDFNRDPTSLARQAALSPREREFTTRDETTSDTTGRLGLQFENLKRQIGSRQANEQEKAQLQQLDAELKIVADAHSAVIKEAENEFAKPPDEKDKVPVVTDVTEMRTALHKLSTATKQKTLAIYTLIGADKFYILLVAPDNNVKVFESPVAAAALNDKVVRFYALLQSPAYDPRPLGKELYEVVFKPVEAELKRTGAQILAWSLDASLRYVPIAALWDGEKYLAELYQNVVFTRADAERLTRNVRRSRMGAGFGSSRAHAVDLLGDGRKINFEALPGVPAELRSIFRSGGVAGILDGEIRLDSKFTKKAFYEALKKRPPLVHISSHFLFRPGDDSRSFLLLGDGSPLTLSEMKRPLKVFDGVELLTLSACNTAATLSDAEGREIDGFAELAQRLGAASVIATLWQVSDASTPWLMRRFYQTRKASPGVTKAEALRRAQLALLNGTADTRQFSKVPRGGTSNVKLIIVRGAPRQVRDSTRADVIYVSEMDAPAFAHNAAKPFAHPYFWSPFVLFGNWQ
jgi:CHAT domain-containing protein/Tfp pilus assembly protein PilF